MTLAALVLSFLALASVFARSDQQTPLGVPSTLKGSKLPQKTPWAQYSPYVPYGVYKTPVDGCVVQQVNILQRHGARYPTSGATAGIVTALEKLQSVDRYTSPDLEFLKGYTYNLGKSDLVEFGASQSFDSGRETFMRYRHLVNDSSIPFVRASGSDRVILSAMNWTAGFAASSGNRYTPVLNLILSEKGNNTLEDNQCPNADSPKSQKNQWLTYSTPAVMARLNEGAPGANLSSGDIYSIMSLCPFDTVATGSLSPFCNIFTTEEFTRIFEYASDLDKYYGTGYGYDLGPVQGVGYVNELIARLTGKPVVDHTQTNTTLDSSPETFPLNRSIYADFSHDNEMIAIYSAVGLFNQSEPLSTTTPNANRTWVVSKMVSFSGRMVTERVECVGQQFVRIYVNDVIQPLEFCGGNKEGMCTLERFLESQAYARNDGQGDFERCFV